VRRHTDRRIASRALWIDRSDTTETTWLSFFLPSVADGHEQNVLPSGMKIVEIIDEVERVARWRGPNSINPFEKLRLERAAKLGIKM